MEWFLRLWILFLLFAGTCAQNISVSVSCGSSHLVISVPVDLFGNGVPVHANELTLGSGCSVTAVRQNTLLLEYPLSACEATRKLLQNSIHYGNVLHYIPSATNGVIRTSRFSHSIDCFYPRSGNVSSLGIQPTWFPFSSTLMDRQRLDFVLEVYDSTWSRPISTPLYYLGDLINIQASVRKGSHVPLRVYVDECVARPSAESSVKYEVITNHGCLVDGQHSHSHFLAAPAAETLRFQLDTFTFIGASDQIYLICHLKAVPTDSTDHHNKACSYDRTTATWSSHEGGDCSCCDSSTGCGSKRRKRGKQQRQGLFGDADLKIGPITLEAQEVNSSMMYTSSNFELMNVAELLSTDRTPHATVLPHHNQFVNTIMRGEVKEDASSGLYFPFSTTTLVIAVACSFIIFVSILGCYFSTRRAQRGYHMEVVSEALGEIGAVTMAPASVGTSRKAGVIVAAASRQGQPASV
ncbi:zona pellucida sperm-binding protein 3-like [Eublepharis macularius]|uniref:Zona pellucida sperm-binding protein 3 n=1 Tax=Eublepharis macularius TaxID=481883 RepID=A0AA97IVN9_EUBMA|nr:zona pellucida sperm-binding protein 3-like [Eublepharis macularius]